MTGNNVRQPRKVDIDTLLQPMGLINPRYRRRLLLLCEVISNRHDFDTLTADPHYLRTYEAFKLMASVDDTDNTTVLQQHLHDLIQAHIKEHHITTLK